MQYFYTLMGNPVFFAVSVQRLHVPTNANKIEAANS